MLGSSEPDHHVHIECATTRGLDPHTIARALCSSGPIRYQTFYNILRITPEEHPAVLLTEATVNPKNNRELMTRLCSRRSTCPRHSWQSRFSCSCVLREKGQVSCGILVSHTVLFFAGLAWPYTIFLLFCAPTEFLVKTLIQRGHHRFRTWGLSDKLCFFCFASRC